MNANIIQTNLAVVDNHFRLELSNVDDALKLYTDDAIWECPARNLRFTGKEEIGNNYRAMAASLCDLEIYPIDRFATEDRVVDDTIVRFTLTGSGFKNAHAAPGSKVELHLAHIFEMRDGKIAKEKSFDLWRTI